MVVKTKQNVAPIAPVASLIEGKAYDIKQSAAEKLKIRDEAKAILQEAAAAYGEGDDKAKTANDIAGRGAIMLYHAQTGGMMSKEEVSSVLGQVFGLKVKKDGTPSKTPDGKGEDIRKRVVRAVASYDFAMKGKPDPYFDGVDPTDVYSVVQSMEQGDISIWTAYNNVGTIVKDAKPDALPLHLNADKLVKLVNDIMSDETALLVSQSDTLLTAYTALSEAIKMMDAKASLIVDATAQAA